MPILGYVGGATGLIQVYYYKLLTALEGLPVMIAMHPNTNNSNKKVEENGQRGEKETFASMGTYCMSWQIIG